MNLRLLNLFFLIALASCGTEDEDKNTATETSYTWAADIAGIVATHCGSTGACHGSGEARTNFVGNKDAVVAAAATITAFIQKPTTDTQVMPPSSFESKLSEENKQKLIDYLNQTTKN